MTTVLNYAICILALLVLGWETWLVAKRNRTVTVAGKDDFFLLCMVMLVAMLLLRPDIMAGFLESLRNTLVLMALFFSLAVKRGLSVRGVEKLGFVIPWDQIEQVQVEPYQLNRLVVYFYTRKKHRFKLFYPKYKLKNLVYEIQKYHPEVLLEKSLQLD